jgi:[protein-PII] uridylyltransferase
VAPTPSKSLNEIRAGVLRRPGLVCAPLRQELTAAYDGWLATRIPDGAPGIALVALGSLGRSEPSPRSDLDLVLLHTGNAADVAEIADSIWYPIWDSGVGLDHSVRSPEEAVRVAREDLKALLGLLDIRHLSGDANLSAAVRTDVLALWRSRAGKLVGELRELAAQRWQLAGEGAFLLEPNVKDSRGGLRDVRLLYALALAQLVDLPTNARAAGADLLDIRGELHRLAGRADDVLHRQEHDAVAVALGLRTDTGEPDRDEVLRRANHAARTVAHVLDLAFRRLAPTVRPSLRTRLFGGTSVRPVREGIARDVVTQDGEVTLARDAAPGTDPGLLVRAARAAAEKELPLATATLDRLRNEWGPSAEPWPDEVRDDFVALLGTGPAAVPVLESLDLAGLLGRLIPEWDAVRSLAQHNPVHLWTVDRHLLETAAQAAAHTREVDRPDLLLVGALLHDIGKGYPGDHSVVGAEHARKIACRMGFADNDIEVIAALTRQHLLLPDTATRRDLDDPMTVKIVADAVDSSAEVVALLYRLSIADAAATGPQAWSEWKAGLIAELVRRVGAVLQGGAMPAGTPVLDPERRELAAAGQLAVVVRDREVIVCARDGVGVLYRTTGVLALHLLDVRQASIHTHDEMAVNSFVVEPRFGRVPDAALVRADLSRALDGELPLAERLHEKERAYSQRRPSRPPTVNWFDREATDATVLEIRTEDSIGLLTRITAALEHSGADVRTARVSTLGNSVVGAFYLTDRRGRRVDAEMRADIEVELRRV